VKKIICRALLISLVSSYVFGMQQEIMLKENGEVIISKITSVSMFIVGAQILKLILLKNNKQLFGEHIIPDNFLMRGLTVLGFLSPFLVICSNAITHVTSYNHIPSLAINNVMCMGNIIDQSAHAYNDLYANTPILRDIHITSKIKIDEISETSGNSDPLKLAAQALRDYAFDNGSSDNISVMVIKLADKNENTSIKKQSGKESFSIWSQIKNKINSMDTYTKCALGLIVTGTTIFTISAIGAIRHLRSQKN